MFLVPFYISTRKLMWSHNLDYGLFMMNRFLFTLPFAVVFVATYPATGIEWFVVATGCLYGFSGIPFQMSYKYTTEFVAAVASEMIPVFAAIIGWLALNERMTPGEIIAFVTVLTGSAFVVMSTSNGRKNALNGYGLFLLATMMAGAYNAGTKYAKNLADFSGFELLVLHRTGVFISMIALLATPLRKRMLRFFTLPGAEKLKFARNELVFLGFAASFALAMAMQPQARSNGLIGVIYFGVLQIGLFLRAVAISEKHLARKAVGAIIASAGLVYLATH